MNMWNKTPRLCWLKVEDVKIPHGRLHSHFDDNPDDFEESVRLDGVIQPIYVIQDENGEYWLADGQNRLETAKKEGKTLIPAIVKRGSKKDAILQSAKLNVLRGKVNVGELAEFIYNLRSRGLKVEEIAKEIRLSKGYISQLITIAQNKEILEKLKKGLISKQQAYESAKSLLSKQASQDTRYDRETAEARQPITDKDLGLTTSLKEAMETGKRFKPLGPEDLKPEKEEPKKTEYMTCDFCGKILPRYDARWIKVHSDEYDKVLLAIHKLREKEEAERETQSGSPQP